jgi:hypothetical protein
LLANPRSFLNIALVGWLVLRTNALLSATPFASTTRRDRKSPRRLDKSIAETAFNPPFGLGDIPTTTPENVALNMGAPADGREGASAALLSPRSFAMQHQRPKSSFLGCSRIADYEVLGKLGEGTFGEVHKARSKKTGAIVALKKIIMHNEKDGVWLALPRA